MGAVLPLCDPARGHLPLMTLRAASPADIGTRLYSGSSDPSATLLRTGGGHTGGMPYQVMSGRFVGRTEELARLRELLARAADGEPLVALVGGEAGVGKTRLADQLAATANGQDVRVLRGGCVPLGEEGLPFAPVT